MYLKALELHGFKSFPDKTVLHFNPGSTVIVGPNGSGKSNITDAMRWVLGELSTKNIRGSKMEDVIFVGADGHRPMSFAEVSVTFDDSEAPRKLNCPYEEVTVTRRYYRAGESEYFINRKPCRLKDINELFMNTGIGREGYSIIGQGRIAEIISKKSDERRGIFEETAGITKYRYKKNEAQKKLADTEDNMTRVRDIYAELEARVGPLEKEAQKARRYLELYDEKKKLDVSLWLLDIEKLRRDTDALAGECRLSAHELDMVRDTEAQLESKYERLFEASQENKQISAGLYEEIRRVTEEINKAESGAKLLENDIAHAEERILASEAAIESGRADEARERDYTAAQEARLEENSQAQTLAAAQSEKLAKSQAEVKDRIAALDAELEAALAVQKEYEAEVSELTVRLSVLRASIDEQGERRNNVRGDTEKYESKLRELITEAEECERSVGEYEQAQKKADEAAAQCDRELLALSDKTETVRKKHSADTAASEALQSRIAALTRMQEHFDGYNNSVKYVMGRAGTELRGIHGPVSSLIRVPDEYIVAMETAFGTHLQNIVVDDEGSAKAAIGSLKAAGAGRATFYPLSSVAGQDKTRELLDAAKQKGFRGYADELLECDGRYKNVISSIVGRIAVFDNIDNASDTARRGGWKIRIVTLDGQQINPGGSFTGGSVRRDSGMLSRGAHIEKLKAEKSELDKTAAISEAELKKLTDKTAELNNFRRKEDEKAKIAEVMLRTERAQLDELTANRGVIESLLTQLRGDMEKLEEVGRRGGEDAALLEKEMEKQRTAAERVAAERSETSIARGACEDELSELAQTASELNIKIATLQNDRENIVGLISEAGQRLAQAQARTAEYEAELERRRTSVKDIRGEIESKTEQAKQKRGELEAAESRRAELEGGSLEYDRRLNEIRIEIKNVSSKKELLLRSHTANESKLERLNADVDKMVARIWDEYELTHSAALGLGYETVTPENRAQCAARLTTLKNQVKALGSVNVAAIEEYTALRERYDYLSAQITDLEKSKEELLVIISSVEEEMKRMFAAAFEAINRYFGETFRELFGGGSAHLTLTDPEDILNSGVEISAAPPGKMIKNLNLLSGGEQAFVAIALVFALIRVNPSPFCIFDEIEAALDEVNVTRVASYVKRFSGELQIIAITHRRGMMETADTLYGVTMPKRGISKVFTLDVSAVEKGQQILTERND